MTYYKMSFGTGIAWLNRYVVKTEYPTTDYSALIDVLIDYLKEKGHRNIITDYEQDENGCITDPEGYQWYADEYYIGGNCGDVLMHYGNFNITEITENEIGDMEVIEAP